MKTKIISMVLSLAVVFFVGFASTKSADAQTVSYPEGCATVNEVLKSH